eukprot:CAMPEP_0204566862 /NCGR_PEP_ID=MMETSP0661-20131031/36280_1 /ASSEMBLY_ACC=CAM_ASM_000606 /TAXON_ID=109239 /ORGANISM="Alexandrium margalefi, Strain AMGDE01CS-322" /LENGTH=40 /DNA_ID= /DNA_START= /DNA_END= /DNA_ORIENTATION=
MPPINWLRMLGVAPVSPCTAYHTTAGVAADAWQSTTNDDA